MTHRPLPWVFRLAAVLLVVAAVVGGWWQRQPAGGATRQLLHHLSRRCPAMIDATTPLTVASGAHAIDRVVLAMLLDRLSPQPTSRCTFKPSDEQVEEATNRSQPG